MSENQYEQVKLTSGPDQSPTDFAVHFTEPFIFEPGTINYARMRYIDLSATTGYTMKDHPKLPKGVSIRWGRHGIPQPEQPKLGGNKNRTKRFIGVFGQLAAEAGSMIWDWADGKWHIYQSLPKPSKPVEPVAPIEPVEPIVSEVEEVPEPETYDGTLSWYAYCYINIPENVVFLSLKDMAEFLLNQTVRLHFYNDTVRNKWHKRIFGVDHPENDKTMKSANLIQLKDYVKIEAVNGTLEFYVQPNNPFDATLGQIKSHPDFEQLVFPYTLPEGNGKQDWWCMEDNILDYSYQWFDSNGNIVSKPIGVNTPTILKKEGKWPNEPEKGESGIFIKLSCFTEKEFVPMSWLVHKNKQSLAVVKYFPEYEIWRRLIQDSITNIRVQITDSQGNVLLANKAYPTTLELLIYYGV